MRFLPSMIVLLASVGLAQDSTQRQTKTPDPVIERIVGATMMRGGAMTFLEALTDTIGGRVTGSPESRAASELILKTLKDAGFGNAHMEEYPLASSWKRGVAVGRIVSPAPWNLMIESYGWVPGTPGKIQAPVKEASVGPDGKLAGDVTSLRGAAVIVDLQGNALSFDTNFVSKRVRISQQLAAVGAAAMFLPSDKPDRMVYTSAAGFYPRGALPVLSLAKEDTAFLRRLMLKQDVRIELEVGNAFIGSATEHNVIADLPGSEPNEVVLLGAHFDSWEPAQGANDNGTGVAAVLEAARVLKSLEIKPKATIRFAFFSGEEQADLGSRAYVKMHQSELNSLRAAVIMDGGAQAPLGFQIHGRADIEAPLKKILSGLEPLGAAHLLPGGDLDTDDESFVVAGVPALSLWVVQEGYDINHHAITDTLDKIDPRMLSLDTAVLAVATYSIANAESRLGRRLARDEVVELLKKIGATLALEQAMD